MNISFSRNNTTQKAFSLLELSVVLIIIALISAGVLKAREHLLLHSRVNAIIQQFETIVGNTYLFIDKYGELPGDSPNFTPAGNNDGMINVYNGLYNQERASAFNHLVEAGYMQGKYYGDFSTTEVFSPHGPEPGSIFVFGSIGLLSNTSLEEKDIIVSYYGYNIPNTTPIGAWETPVATPLEALLVDSKIDDSYGQSGIIRSNFDHYSAGCASLNYPGEYKTRFENKSCSLYYVVPD